jgi:hypothetical protein
MDAQWEGGCSRSVTRGRRALRDVARDIGHRLAVCRAATSTGRTRRSTAVRSRGPASSSPTVILFQTAVARTSMRFAAPSGRRDSRRRALVSIVVAAAASPGAAA